MERTYKRRNYFIDKRFQTKFMLKFSTIVIAGSVIVGLALLFLTAGSTTVAIENTKIIVKKTADFLFPLILIILILVTLFSAISVAILAMFISHKIAGPLYRLKREIDKIASGDFNVDFHIRSEDQLKNLAESLNLMIHFLRDKVGALKELEKSPSGNGEKIKEICGSLKL